MNLIVLDTNVIVSALWNRNGNPAMLLKMFFENEITLFYDKEIFDEYNRVLRRSKYMSVILILQDKAGKVSLLYFTVCSLNGAQKKS